MSEHGVHADPADPFQKRVAVTLAIYTVELAFANMLTNQARTKAIILSNKATDQWAYYQAKSTRETLVRSQAELTKLLGSDVEHTAEVKRLTEQGEKYGQDKERISKDAEKLAHEGEGQEHREHYFEYGATIVEIGIVLAGLSLLTSSRVMFYASIVFAVASAGLTAYTYAAVGLLP